MLWSAGKWLNIHMNILGGEVRFNEMLLSGSFLSAYAAIYYIICTEQHFKCKKSSNINIIRQLTAFSSWQKHQGVDVTTPLLTIYSYLSHQLPPISKLSDLLLLFASHIFSLSRSVLFTLYRGGSLCSGYMHVHCIWHVDKTN